MYIYIYIYRERERDIVIVVVVVAAVVVAVFVSELIYSGVYKALSSEPIAVAVSHLLSDVFIIIIIITGWAYGHCSPFKARPFESKL